MSDYKYSLSVFMILGPEYIAQTTRYSFRWAVYIFKSPLFGRPFSNVPNILRVEGRLITYYTETHEVLYETDTPMSKGVITVTWQPIY